MKVSLFGHSKCPLIGTVDCGRKPGNVEGTSKYLHTDDPKQDLPGFLQGFHPSAHFSTTPTVRGHVCLDLSQEGTPETFQLLVETFPLQMSSSLWENLENTHIQKVPAPDRQGSRSAFHGRTLSSSFPKDPDNGAGLAWGSPPPRSGALLAASMAAVCPQSHVGAQTREPSEPRRPCKQSGPLGMHVRIYRRVLCHRWHLFSWWVGAGEILCDRRGRAAGPAGLKEPVSISNILLLSYGPHACRIVP